jgi:hypothetical protein
MLAALLLSFARRLIEGTTPIHLVEPPAAGTGKGVLVGVLYVLATRRAAEAGTLPQDKDEVRKKITVGAAGVSGFLGNLESLYEVADEEGSLWRELVAAW